MIAALQQTHMRAMADAHLRRIMALHFHPHDGSPYWLDQRRHLQFDPLSDVHSVADLPMFGDFPIEQLAERPVLDFVPRRFRHEPGDFITAETGGTTGAPKRTAYRLDEFHAAFVHPFVDAAHAMNFPRRCSWLYIGPSGPHIVGKGARACAAALGAMDPFSVDFDPRWFRKLAPGSIARDRYLDHVLEQALRILAIEPIEVLFSTPPVLAALGQQLSAVKRMEIRGVHLGGIAADSTFWNSIRRLWFPNAVVLSGYGNTLAGLCPQVQWEDGQLPSYFPHGARLQISLRKHSPEEPRGQVVFSRLDESCLLPNVAERDEATWVERPNGPGMEAFARIGIHDPRPPAEAGALLEGLY